MKSLIITFPLLFLLLAISTNMHSMNLSRNDASFSLLNSISRKKGFILLLLGHKKDADSVISKLPKKLIISIFSTAELLVQRSATDRKKERRETHQLLIAPLFTRPPEYWD